jgi:phosphoribosylaminoimidazole-succinocarboxamide synthase
MAEVPELPLAHLHRGKVRDLFDAGDDRVLMIASDRLSAFDVVMAEPVPDKGRVLTAMSVFWFDELADVVGNHLLSTDLSDLPPAAQLSELEGRFMLCRRVEMLPVECIVRGFLAGSAWKEYRDRGTVHAMAMPSGMVEAERLAEPIFTPSTKAAVGDHDENISFDAMVGLLGGEPGHVPCRGATCRGTGLPPRRHEVRAGLRRFGRRPRGGGGRRAAHP